MTNKQRIIRLIFCLAIATLLIVVVGMVIEPAAIVRAAPPPAPQTQTVTETTPIDLSCGSQTVEGYCAADCWSSDGDDFYYSANGGTPELISVPPGQPYSPSGRPYTFNPWSSMSLGDGDAMTWLYAWSLGDGGGSPTSTITTTAAVEFVDVSIDPCACDPECNGTGSLDGWDSLSIDFSYNSGGCPADSYNAWESLNYGISTTGIISSFQVQVSQTGSEYVVREWNNPDPENWTRPFSGLPGWCSGGATHLGNGLWEYENGNPSHPDCRFDVGRSTNIRLYPRDASTWEAGFSWEIISVNGVDIDSGGDSTSCTIQQAIDFTDAPDLVMGREVEVVDLPEYGIYPLVNGTYRGSAADDLELIYRIDEGYEDSVESHVIHWSDSAFEPLFDVPICEEPELSDMCPEPDWPIWEIGNWIHWLWCKVRAWLALIVGWLAYIVCVLYAILATIANGVAEFFYNIWFDASGYFNQLANLLQGFFNQLGNWLEATFGAFGLMIIDAFDALGDYLQAIAEWWGDTFQAAFTAWGNWFAEWFDEFGNFMEATLTWWGQTIQAAWTTAGNWYSAWFNEFGDFLEGVFDWLAQTIQGGWTAWGNWIAAWFNEFGDFLEAIIAWWSQTLQNFFSSWITWINLSLTEFADFFSAWGTEWGDFLAMVVNEVNDFILARLYWVSGVIRNWFDAVGAFVNMAVTEFGAWLGAILTWIGDVYFNLFTAIGQFLNWLLTTFGDWLGRIMIWWGETVGGTLIGLGQWLNRTLTAYGAFWGDVLIFVGDLLHDGMYALGAFLNMVVDQVGLWIGNWLISFGMFLNLLITTLGRALANIIRLIGSIVQTQVDIIKLLMPSILSLLQIILSIISSVMSWITTLLSGLKDAINSTEAADMFEDTAPFFWRGLEYFEDVVGPSPLAVTNLIAMGFIGIELLLWTMKQFQDLIGFLMDV
jgi:phage-related protein